MLKVQDQKKTLVQWDDWTDLGKRGWVQSILAGQFEPDVVGTLGIPRGLGAGLDLGIDAVIVRGREDAEVVGGRDGGGVLGHAVADRGRVARDGGLLHVVRGLGPGQEALVPDHGVERRGRTPEQVEEGARVEVGLPEEEVHLSALGLRRRQEVRQHLGLEALGDAVVELELGVERVVRRPGLGQGQA